MSTTLDISDAVVVDLNSPVFSPAWVDKHGASFSQTFTAVRSVMPIYEISDLVGLKITVVPHGVELNRQSRDLWVDDHEIHVAVQKRLTDDIESSIEAMCDLTREIADYLKDKNIAVNSDSARPVHTAIEPIYDPGHLSGSKVFVSVVKVVYKD